MRTPLELGWDMFAVDGPDGFHSFGELHIAEAGPADGPIVRVSIDADPEGGDWTTVVGAGVPREFRRYVPAGARDRHELRFTIVRTDYTADSARRAPGDRAEGSLRWTMHPGATGDRAEQLKATFDDFATTETLWYLAASPDSYVRRMATFCKACPADLLEWCIENDPHTARQAEMILLRRGRTLPRMQSALANGDDRALARSPWTDPALLDDYARNGRDDLRVFASANPATPIGAVAALMRTGSPRARVTAALRFESVLGNTRWTGFSTCAVATAVEGNLDDDTADALLDLDDAEIADNFGRWHYDSA